MTSGKRNSMVEYLPETHQYKVAGKLVPSVTEVTSLLRPYADIPEHILRVASARGTDVHAETMLMDLCGNTIDELESDWAEYLTAWKRFCNDYRPTWQKVEHRMFGRRFAGCADRIGSIDGIPVIADIKTSASFDRSAQIALACQLAGYCRLYAENTGVNIRPQDCIGIQLGADGKYKVLKVEDIEKKYRCHSSEMFEDLLKIIEILKY